MLALYIRGWMGTSVVFSWLSWETVITLTVQAFIHLQNGTPLYCMCGWSKSRAGQHVAGEWHTNVSVRDVSGAWAISNPFSGEHVCVWRSCDEVPHFQLWFHWQNHTSLRQSSLLISSCCSAPIRVLKVFVSVKSVSVCIFVSIAVYSEWLSYNNSFFFFFTLMSLLLYSRKPWGRGLYVMIGFSF